MPHCGHAHKIDGGDDDGGGDDAGGTSASHTIRPQSTQLPARRCFLAKHPHTACSIASPCFRVADDGATSRYAAIIGEEMTEKSEQRAEMTVSNALRKQ